MTNDEAYEAVATAYKNFWNDETPIAWGDNEFDASKLREFVRFSWQMQGGSQVSLGPKSLQRYEGILFVQIFTARGKGLQSKRNRMLQQKCCEFFETQLTDVVFVNTGPRYIGNNGAFEQTNVSSEFWFDNVRAA